MDLEKGDMLWDLGASLVDFLSVFISDFKFNKDNISVLHLVINIAFLVILISILAKTGRFIYEALIRRKNNKILTSVLHRLESHEGIEKFEDLLKSCRKLGKKIDNYTARKGNSSMVALLVFRIAESMGLATETIFLYICVSLVYDCGFLDIPEELFHAEILSYRELVLIRSHVMRIEKFLDFVPKQYYSLFYEAAMLHHENMDGSGYPEGLKGEDIPLAPRIIHIVESYVALVSRRSYHKTLSRKKAFIELRKRKGSYDEMIINTLEKVI